MRPALKRLAIVSLVSGSFGLGASQYLVMALLPEITDDLAGTAGSGDIALAEFATSFLASGYSLGVVFGLIVLPMLVRRMSDTRVLQGCAAVLLLLTMAVALSPSLALAVPVRFLSAIVHATYLGTASIVVARMLGSGRDGRGAAIVIGGMAAANLVVVPILTAVGAAVSWRLGLGVAALLFLPAVLVFFFVTPLDADTAALGASSPKESRRKANGVALLAVMLALMSAAIFAAVTFIAPIARELQGGQFTLPMALVMLAFGAGMNLGNYVGGWQADRAPVRGLWIWIAAGGSGFATLLASNDYGVTAALGASLVGTALGGMTPCAQVLFLRFMTRRRRLGASLAPAVVNLGNFAGTATGGLAMVGLGVHSLPLVSLGFLMLAAGILLVLSVRMRASAD